MGSRSNINESKNDEKGFVSFITCVKLSLDLRNEWTWEQPPGDFSEPTHILAVLQVVLSFFPLLFVVHVPWFPVRAV